MLKLIFETNSKNNNTREFYRASVNLKWVLSPVRSTGRTGRSDKRFPQYSAKVDESFLLAIECTWG